MKYAYVRVSTVEQNEERQIEGLQKHGIDEWFMEKVSGKSMDRPELQRLLATVKEGDTIYVHDFSRLARSTKDLLDMIDSFNERNVSIVSNKENIDTGTPGGRLMLTIIAAIYEFERTNMLERQAEGIEIAKREGKYKNCGRKQKDIDRELFDECLSKYRRKEMTKTAFAKTIGVSRMTLDVYLKNL